MIRVRFAPSPTGHLHIGGLRAALFNWLFARHNGGKFLLRIEDTDIERSKDIYTQSILEALHWCSLTSDEPVLIQSRRLEEHKKLVEQLLSSGSAYKCYCTQQDLERRFGAPDGDFTRYDKYCRDRVSESSDQPYVIRFKIPSDVGNITFHDLIRDTVSFDVESLDDFIIVRSDGTPTYNFVVVADDAYMKITHVIRGEEHLSNTPKQILIYQALHFDIPHFAHLPLILGPEGNKLSKRDAAVAAIDYKKQGFLPWALCNYLARLGWAHGDQEIFTREEMIKYFTLDEVSKKGAIFDIKKLEWVNGVYLHHMPSEELLAYIHDQLDQNFERNLADWDREKLRLALDLYKERVKTINELIYEITLLYEGTSAITEHDYKQFVAPVLPLIQATRDALSILEPWKAEALSALLKRLVKDFKVSLASLAQPLRLALVGKTTSPGVFELLALVGKEKSIKRIDGLLKKAE